MSKNVLSLFSGAGGAVVGFKQAGHNVVAAVDFDDDCIETLNANHDDVQIIQANLGDTTPYEFALEYDIASSDIDIVIGGPPCQGFSLNGNRNPDDERNELVSDFLDYVQFYQPESIVMENVTGMLSMNDGAAVDYTHERLEDMGYKSNHCVLNAVDLGVPQGRERVIFIGRREKYILWPETTDERVSVSEAFENTIEEHKNHTIPNAMPKAEEKIANAFQGEQLYDSYNKNIRLEANRPSPTLVASGGAWQFGHPIENRVLTVHERALLQTFPPEYVFKGGVMAGRRQTGNALPPKMAAAIAREL